MQRNQRQKIRSRFQPDRVIGFRSRLVAGLFAVCFVLIFAKTFQIQVLQHDKFLQMAKNRQELRVQLRPNRGTIYDRTGEPLAVTVETDSVYVRPHRVTDPQTVARVLAQTLGLEKGFVERKLKSKQPFVWIKRQIHPEESKAMKLIELEGVGAIPEPDRNYPYGRLAGPLLGYTGVDLQGLAGIEAMYEKELRGEGGARVGERDALGNALYPDGILFEGTRKGRSIRLTIDAKIQFYADSAVARAYERYKPEGICAIVMQPHTGEILAMSAMPGFDPNSGLGYKRNIGITDVFEVGSTFKPFAMAAALDQGAISVDEKINCANGAFPFGGSIIHDVHGHGDLYPAEIIKFSSNIGITKVAARLGATKWYQSLNDYGFGVLTGSLLPNESPGILRPVQSWRKIDIATSAFGQGVSVTPLQLTTAFCALVNGGNLMRPRLVSGVYDERDDLVERIDPQIVRRVISRQTSRTITDMMALVTQPGGTAVRAAIPGYSVAGKTGTAQKPAAGGYSADKRVSSFIGCVPAERPDIAVLVILDDPKGSTGEKYGGVCAAPVFKEIAERTLNYRGNVGKERVEPKPNDLRLAEEPKGATQTKTIQTADAGFAPDQMPDLVGLSVRNALRLAEMRGLDLTVIGSGVAVRQNPEPGTVLDKTKKGTVLFRPAS